MLPVRLAPTFAFTVLLAVLASLSAKVPVSFPRGSRLSVQSESQRSALAPDTCPITQPPSEPFVPPAPYPSKISSDGFWLGSEKL
jgi:hypothetical protein